MFWLAYFGKSLMQYLLNKVIFHDDIKADIRATYDDLLAFLELPPVAEVSFRPMNDNKTIRNRFIARITERNAGVRYTRKLHRINKGAGSREAVAAI
jgi:hypothetical protein